MREYISKDYINKRLEAMLADAWGAEHYAYGRMRDEIKYAPVDEIVHFQIGKWMKGYPICCSVCGGAAATDYEDANRYEAWLSPYCPNCGARMMEVDE